MTDAPFTLILLLEVSRSLVAIPLSLIHWYRYCSNALYNEHDECLSMHESNMLRMALSDTLKFH